MAKKKLTKKIVEDEVIEDPIEWDIGVPEGLLSDSVFEEEVKERVDTFVKEREDFFIKTSRAPVTTQKTFFDFTYSCCHPENTSHCIECYNKARKG